MKQEVVIDTNVYVHSHNRSNAFHCTSLSVLTSLLSSNIHICVDDVFDVDSSKNTSIIGHEYIKHIRSGTYGYFVLITLIKERRIKQIQKSNYKNIKRDFRKLISNSHDLALLVTTFASTDKYLISNDFNDFTCNIRHLFPKRFGIIIVSSDQANIPS